MTNEQLNTEGLRKWNQKLKHKVLKLVENDEIVPHVLVRWQHTALYQ